ncbi:MAG: isochorismate synthase MenF [Cyanophyceae cyanobacterium]
MLATPLVASPAENLHQLLLNCQEKFLAKDRAKIISFSQEIEPVDPLAVLKAVEDEQHFYWEAPSQEEAIIGYGTTKEITIAGSERFVKARSFIQECLKQTIRIGDFNLLGAGPRFFCSFTFAPHSNAPFPAATVFLPRFQVIRAKQRCILVANVAIDRGNIKSVLEQIRKEIQTVNLSKCQSFAAKFNVNRQTRIVEKTQAATHFKTAVTGVLKSIQKEEFSKAVLARAIDVVASQRFDIADSLNNLRRRHPDCYIFSTSNGRGQAFIGASPERLISICDRQLVTDALAGSAPRGKTAAEDVRFAKALLNSKKEQREHQAVTQFIVQQLQQLGLHPQRSPRQLLQLSNIQHLWTPIQARLPDDLNPLDIVAKLHPTPAVAGVPTPIACEQIRRYEDFDRGLYAAPLGWIDYQGNSHFLVGIRSALIEGDRARLYAGAGIVAGSDPEREYAEVQLKLQSLLKALV